jgi:DNA-binding transcriptional MerR regulator
MNAKRTIGGLAKETGVGIETIRFYERKGLIDQPVAIEGFRHYDEHAVATVRYIKLAQQLGLKLADVLALKSRLGDGKGFCNALRDAARGRLGRIADELAELRRLEAELTGFLARCEQRDPEKPCPILVELGALGSALKTPKPKGVRK